MGGHGQGAVESLRLIARARYRSYHAVSVLIDDLQAVGGGLTRCVECLDPNPQTVHSDGLLVVAPLPSPAPVLPVNTPHALGEDLQTVRGAVG